VFPDASHSITVSLVLAALSLLVRVLTPNRRRLAEGGRHARGLYMQTQTPSNFALIFDAKRGLRIRDRAQGSTAIGRNRPRTTNGEVAQLG
jgi:hypothetical protein